MWPSLGYWPGCLLPPFDTLGQQRRKREGERQREREGEKEKVSRAPSASGGLGTGEVASGMHWVVKEEGGRNSRERSGDGEAEQRRWRQPRRHPGWQGRARRRSQLHEQGRGKAAAASARGSGRLRRGSGHDRRGRGAPTASSFGNHGLGSRCSGGGGAQSSSAWPRQRLRLRRPSLRVLEARLRCVEAGAPCPSAGLIGVGSELRVTVECSSSATPGGYL
jgi:hypothetical protein